MEKERNYGIDLLKIIATTMVIILHLLVHGGVQENLMPLSQSYNVMWLLGIVCDCAVNCFAIISGYVSYEKKFKYTSIVRLHLTVLFHTIVLTWLVGNVFFGEFNKSDLIMSFFPVATNTYWYYTAFLGLFFFMPLLNKGIQMLDKNQENLLFGGIIFFLSVVPTITGADVFYVNKGFSLLWLMALYLIGCYMKKHKNDLQIAKHKLLIMYGICILTTWGLKLGLECLCMATTGTIGDFSVLTDYCSPTILYAAIALVLFFSSLKISSFMAKVTSFFVPCSFGVYLIHDHPVVRQSFIYGKMVHIAKNSPWEQIIALFQSVIVIWSVCILLEFIRRYFFKILSIEKLLMKIEQFIEKEGNLKNIRL